MYDEVGGLCITCLIRDHISSTGFTSINTHLLVHLLNSPNVRRAIRDHLENTMIVHSLNV